MTSSSASQAAPAEAIAGGFNNAAFEFVKSLASELSGGKIDLPSFPDVAVRVRRALADEKTTVEQVVRIVGSEPALAARLLKMANSAALNRSGKPVTDLRTAINRMGYNMVRSAAISFAMAQIRMAASLKALEPHLKELWTQSTYVAAFSYVLAKRSAPGVNADEAFLTGLLHGVGKLYVLTRAERHPVLFADEATLRSVVADWHASIGRTILENWEFAPEMVEAIGDQEDVARRHEGSADLTDVLVVANTMTSYIDHPGELELNLQGIAAFEMLGMDSAACQAAYAECQKEVEALASALGA